VTFPSETQSETKARVSLIYTDLKAGDDVIHRNIPSVASKISLSAFYIFYTKVQGSHQENGFLLRLTAPPFSLFSLLFTLWYYSSFISLNRIDFPMCPGSLLKSVFYE
jgi:hypothetical protein